jgi:beta-glucosidase-like glycosyl hydrolase
VAWHPLTIRFTRLTVSTVLLLLGCLPTWAQVQPARVSLAEQRVRDDERLRILESELQREQQNEAAAARIQTERESAGDRVAAERARAAQQRSAESIAALQREIARLPRRDVERVQPAIAAPAQKGPDRGRWWDVYAKTAGLPAPAPDSPTRTPAAVVHPQ